MNDKNLDSIAIDYIKNKLTLGLLNNIYEICSYLDNNSYNNMTKEICAIKDTLPAHFTNIKTVLSSDFEKRAIYIEALKKDIQTLETLALPINALLNFSDSLISIVGDFYQSKLVNISSNNSFDKDKTLDKFYTLIDIENKNNTLGENAGLFLSISNLSMTKDNYNDYLKKSFSILFENSSEKTLATTIENLKFKFAPFKFATDTDAKDMLLNIANMELQNLSEEELLNILEQLDSLDYSNQLGDIYVIYGCLMDILAIYTFAVDFDYIFDFKISDMYYASCEMLKNKSFELMAENIENMVDTTFEDLINQTDLALNSIKKQISKKPINNYSDAIKVCVALEEYSALSLDKNLILKTSNVSNNIASEDFFNEKFKDFIAFIENLNIDNKFLKKLKQQFFFYIPCPLNMDSLKLYLDNSIDKVSEETGILIDYKVSTFLNPESFFNDLDENAFSDDAFNDDLFNNDSSHNHL